MKRPEDAAKEEAAILEGMETLMRAYEEELKSPVWNLVNGSLARALLIQVIVSGNSPSSLCKMLTAGDDVSVCCLHGALSELAKLVV